MRAVDDDRILQARAVVREKLAEIDEDLAVLRAQRERLMSALASLGDPEAIAHLEFAHDLVRSSVQTSTGGLGVQSWTEQYVERAAAADARREFTGDASTREGEGADATGHARPSDGAPTSPAFAAAPAAPPDSGGGTVTSEPPAVPIVSGEGGKGGLPAPSRPDPIVPERKGTPPPPQTSRPDPGMSERAGARGGRGGRNSASDLAAQIAQDRIERAAKVANDAQADGRPVLNAVGSALGCSTAAASQLLSKAKRLGLYSNRMGPGATGAARGA